VNEEMAVSRDPLQLSIWDVAPKGRGRKTERPWGCPTRPWYSYRMQLKRAGAADLQELVQRRSARPWWISPEDWTAKDEIQASREDGRWWEPPREPKPEKETAKIVSEEKVIFAAATASAATKALIEGGRFPGVRWVPGVGGVRTITRRTLAC
jgi:hypothetical protein